MKLLAIFAKRLLDTSSFYVRPVKPFQHLFLLRSSFISPETKRRLQGAEGDQKARRWRRRVAHPAVSARRGHASTRLTLDTYSH